VAVEDCPLVEVNPVETELLGALLALDPEDVEPEDVPQPATRNTVATGTMPHTYHFAFTHHDPFRMLSNQTLDEISVCIQSNPRFEYVSLALKIS
jgi:hypothetical protein